MAKILVVSDSHLSPAAPQADRQWRAVVDEVARRSPNLVVHTGDITLRGATDPTELAHARRLLDQLQVRWVAIPGNHDIGDCGDTADLVDDARRAAYSCDFGASTWAVDVDGWHLIGVDIQTLSTPSAAADSMWQWLTEALEPRRPAALFIHRPLLPHADGELDQPNRYVVAPTRERLVDLIDASGVSLVVSGHVHQWRVAGSVRCRHVWAPSTWACLPDSIQPRIGTKVTGIVEIDLTAEGQATARLVRPVGLTNPTIGEDFDSPY